jgi:hypothetical protein
VEIEKNQKLSAFELQKREVELQEFQIELEKKKKLAEIEVLGQLALQERDIELQEKKIALRERDTEIRERNLAIQEKQIQLQNKDPSAGDSKFPPPPSKEKTPAPGPTKKPPPLAKENAPTKVHNTKQSVLYAKDQNPPSTGAGGKQSSTTPIIQFSLQVWHMLTL